jgi:hypothetical protein
MNPTIPDIKVGLAAAVLLISGAFGSCARSRYTIDPNAHFSHQIAIPDDNLDAEVQPPIGPLVGECGWVQVDGRNYYVVRWQIKPVVPTDAQP